MNFFIQKKISEQNHLFTDGRDQATWYNCNTLNLCFGVEQFEFWLPDWLS